MPDKEQNWLQRKAREVGAVLGIKSSAAEPAILAMTPGAAVWKTRDYRAFAKEGYTENADAYSCINLLATALKGMRFFPYRKDVEGKPDEIHKGPLVDLMERPNPRQSWGQFIEGVVIYLMCAGNCYIERAVGTSGTKAPVELWTPRPDRIEIVKGDLANPIKGFRYIPEINPAGNTTWPADQISGRGLVQRLLHLKFFHPIDDWYGLSAMEAASRSIDQNNESQAWNVAMLQNGMRPSGALVFEGSLGDDQREKLDGDLREKHSGPGNVGKTLIIDGSKFDYKPLSNNAVDMCWMEGQGLATRRTCSVFKVPSQLIGDEQAKTYANYEEARKAFYFEGVLPLADFITGELSYWLGPFFGEDVYIGYDKNEIEEIQEDRAIIYDRSRADLLAGKIMLDEARALTGDKPLPNGAGKVFFIPSTVVPTPLAQLGQLATARARATITGANQSTQAGQPGGAPPPAGAPKKPAAAKPPKAA